MGIYRTDGIEYFNKQKDIMKKILFLLIAVLATQVTTAQNILIVDRSETSPSGDNYYSDLQEAIISSADGDIIYVMPNVNSYGNIEIHNQFNLTIIGAGYNVAAASLDRPYHSRILNLEMRNSHNITLKGLYINGAGGFEIGNALESESTNILIDETFIARLDIDRANNITISNSFIYSSFGTSSSRSENISVLNSVLRVSQFSTVYNSSLENCLITGASLSTTVGSSIFKNNIFANNSTTSEGPIWASNNNTFINNFTTTPISYNDGSNTGSGNIELIMGLDGIFADDSVRADVDWSSDWLLTPEHELIIIGGSDGTDIGPTGGANPMDGSPIFSLPTIYELRIPTEVKAGEDIEVTIKAKGN